MKAIMVMFDSLNRHMLPPYGCESIQAFNFARLAEQAATFDNCYVGSMPCIPARRELHTGRYNFLHRSWGPLEPFDDSMPEILKENGIYTHLITDHLHYFEDGGVNYHTRYNSWEYLRGQQGDPWLGVVKDPEIPPMLLPIPEEAPRWFQGLRRQDWVNRARMPEEHQHPQAKTFDRGLKFIHENHDADNWFLHIETFDPHEPFFSSERFKDLYPDDYAGPHFDWPPYRQVEETPEQVDHMRNLYAALLSMCDHYLGTVLDAMDRYDLWKDTMLIVNTDHGFLLGEHDWWAKVVQPFYNEVAHIPLFIWDPRCGIRNARRAALVQMIDLPATLLDYFDVEQPPDMQGASLRETIEADVRVRDAALFGVHGGHVNITDGRYVYMRAPATAENAPLYEYTLMPSHMRTPFTPTELAQIESVGPLAFSKDCQMMKIKSRPALGSRAHDFGTLLFDLEQDPVQAHPLKDAAVEQRLSEGMVQLMQSNNAPSEQYTRLGLTIKD